MSSKNFIIKNGLTVGTTEVIDSSGNVTASGVGAAVQEAIADKIGGILSATGGATATYDDGADTIVIDVAITDEDDMSSDSATAIPSQQSVKAYVDSQVASKDDLSELSGTTDDVTEGSSNLYFTNERVDDRVNALITEGTGITSTYDDTAGTLTLATTITQYADSDARGSISVTDSGGDGSLSYDNSTGVITYTGPSASEVQAHITAGTGVSISSGEVSIGQAVATSSNVEFGNLTLSGNLTVNGSTVTNSSTNTTIEDALIELGSGNTGANSNDLGLVLERGSTGDNAFMGWDESEDRFVVATTTATGSSTGALTLSEANFRASQISTSYASNSGGVARNIYQNTSAPTSGDGQVGDLWILYS